MTEFPDDADGAVLAELASHGIDLSQPLLIEFPVAVADEATAAIVSKALAEEGYDYEVEYDEGEPNADGIIDPDDEEYGSTWTVYASVRMIPEYDEIIRIQEDLDRIARPLGGFSDGWGVLMDEDIE